MRYNLSLGGQSMPFGIVMRHGNQKCILVKGEKEVRTVSSDGIKSTGKRIVSILKEVMFFCRLMWEYARSNEGRKEHCLLQLTGLAAGIISIFALCDALVEMFEIQKLGLTSAIIEMTAFIFMWLLTLLIPIMRETYRFHSAEHMTLNAYSMHLTMTKENILIQSSIHPRCGTIMASWLIAGEFLGTWVGGFFKETAGWAVYILILVLFSFVGYKTMTNGTHIIRDRKDRIYFRLSLPGRILERFVLLKPYDRHLDNAVTALKKISE